jgi:hypothetical protein
MMRYKASIVPVAVIVKWPAWNLGQARAAIPTTTALACATTPGE